MKLLRVKAVSAAAAAAAVTGAAAQTSAAGIAMPRSHLAASVEEAVEAAVTLGMPVAVKAVGAELLHKTEHRALRLAREGFEVAAWVRSPINSRSS